MNKQMIVGKKSAIGRSLLERRKKNDTRFNDVTSVGRTKAKLLDVDFVFFSPEVARPFIKFTGKFDNIRTNVFGSDMNFDSEDFFIYDGIYELSNEDLKLLIDNGLWDDPSYIERVLYELGGREFESGVDLQMVAFIDEFSDGKSKPVFVVDFARNDENGLVFKNFKLPIAEVIAKVNEEIKLEAIGYADDSLIFTGELDNTLSEFSKIEKDNETEAFDEFMNEFSEDLSEDFLEEFFEEPEQTSLLDKDMSDEVSEAYVKHYNKVIEEAKEKTRKRKDEEERKKKISLDDDMGIIFSDDFELEEEEISEADVSLDV